MKTRILFGSILIVVLVGLLVGDWWLGELARTAAADARREGQLFAGPFLGIPLGVLCITLIPLAFREVTRMVRGTGADVLPVSGVFGACLLGTMPFWFQGISPLGPDADALLLVLGLILLVVFAEQMIRHRTEKAISHVAATLLAVLYLGVGTAMILSIRIRYGVPVLVLFLVAVKFTDIGAYFTGSWLGRHKMIPWLSPGKSWEGLVGGVLVAAGMSVLVAWALRVTAPGATGPIAWYVAAIFGAIVGLFGQFADLCESLMKRTAAVKDSGALVPSFGGVLDILDSPLLAAPIASLLLGLLL